MKLAVNFPNGDKQKVFLDHFNALLRIQNGQLSGEVKINEDGTFERLVTSSFAVDQQQLTLKWHMFTASDGTLSSIDVCCVDPEVNEDQWQAAAVRFFEQVSSAAFWNTKVSFFHRQVFCYMGVQLDGEYWLPGFRLAPAFPQDPQPFLLNAERILFIDSNVDAIDSYVAAAIGKERAQKYAARMSFLLNVGLYPVQQGHHKWVITENVATGQLINVRHELGVIPPNSKFGMPTEGELCSIGKYSGSLQATYIVPGKLWSLPPETKRLLLSIDRASPQITHALDSSLRLYHIALNIGSQFPSAGLAYRVAAVEALAQSKGVSQGFNDFVRENIDNSNGLEQKLQSLFPSMKKTTHFRRGAFHMGEYDAESIFDPLMDLNIIETMRVYQIVADLSRQSILGWLKRVVVDCGCE